MLFMPSALDFVAFVPSATATIKFRNSLWRPRLKAPFGKLRAGFATPPLKNQFAPGALCQFQVCGNIEAVLQARSLSP
jgi:hypothetical protein